MDTIENQSLNAPQGGLLTHEIEKEIAATHPWMRFISIVGIIFLILVVFGIIALLSSMRAMNDVGMIIIAVYAVLLIVAFFPVLYLLQSGSSFKNYLETKDRSTLLRALEKNKAHWRIVSIIMIVYVSLSFLGLILTFIGWGNIFSRL
jgi:hypothetical protein